MGFNSAFKGLNLLFEYFSKVCRENSSLAKIGQEKTNTLHEDQYAFLIISLAVLLTMRNVSDKSCRGNQNTNFMFSNPFSKFLLIRR